MQLDLLEKNLAPQPLVTDSESPRVFTRELSTDKKCRCAQCQIVRDCPHLVFVPVCADCWQTEKKRIEKQRVHRRWGITR